MTLHSNFTPANLFAADALDRCAHLVTDFVERLNNLGALVAIDVEGVGRVTLTAGHSDLAKSRPVEPDDVFQIGSQSKTITAMILVLMARDGLLDLDDPVHAYVDLPIDRRITVRHLLMNASGLGEYTFGLFIARPDLRIVHAPRDLVALALPQGQVFEPGERFDYCNTGWVIAAMIIEAVDGRSYGEAAAERIVKPLGLDRTGFGGIVPEGERMRCYTFVPNVSEPVDTSLCLSWGFGAGDGLCSANDILTIYQSLLRAESPLSLSLDDLARETMKPGPKPYFALSFGTEYGLGLERRAWAGSEVWGHPGSTGASRTSTWIDASRRVAVTTAITDSISLAKSDEDALRYPREQLFSMALNTAYALVAERP